MSDKDERKQNKYITDEEAEKLYITEKIIDKRKRKWLNRLVTFLFIVVCAVVFGIIARLVFEISGDKINSLLGKNEVSERTEVDIKQKTNTPAPPTPTARIYPALTNTPIPPDVTDTPEIKPSAAPTDNMAVVTPTTPTATPTVTPTAPTPTPTPELIDIPPVTQQPDVTPTDVPTPSEGDTDDQASNQPSPTGAAEYVAFLKEVMETADEVANSVCNVEIITLSTDWFGSVNETVEDTTGLLIGQDGVDVLILVDANVVPANASVKIELEGENFDADIYDVDKDYGLAVLAVDIKKIPAEVFENLNYAILCEEEDVKNGVPVVAFGRANGHENSIAIGAVTSTENVVNVKDGEIRYFTVDWPDNNNASAFVFNLEGYVCGMVTHTYKDNINDGITSCVFLDSLKDVITRLVNGRKICFYGIIGDEVPSDVSNRTGIEAGIFVNEVLGGSPAYLAGMKNGDIIISINDVGIKSMKDFMRILYTAEPGAVLKTTYKRMKNNEGISTDTVDVIISEK